MENEELLKRITDAAPWFHSIDFGNGIVTSGIAPIEDQKERCEIYLGMGIEGLTVLDVGAWDGYYSFEAERLGASRVLAVDYFAWGGGGWGKREPFVLARDVLKSKVEDRILDIPQTTVEQVGQFDVVLFNGIIYHILDPVNALINMAAITRKMFVAETFIDNLDIPRPVMVYFGAEKNVLGYPENGWGPNSLLMHGLLKKLGFETVLEFPTPDNAPNRSIFIAFKPNHGFDVYVDKNGDFAKPRFTGKSSGIEPAVVDEENSRLDAEIQRLSAEIDAIRAGDKGEEISRLNTETQRLSTEIEALRDQMSWRSLISAIRRRFGSSE